MQNGRELFCGPYFVNLPIILGNEVSHLFIQDTFDLTLILVDSMYISFSSLDNNKTIINFTFKKSSFVTSIFSSRLKIGKPNLLSAGFTRNPVETQHKINYIVSDIYSSH